MKIKLTDTVHFSELGRDAKVKGDIVDVPEGQANDLVKRGLAIKLAGNRKRRPTGKARGASPSNKAEGASPKNKAEGPSVNVRRAGSSTAGR